MLVVNHGVKKGSCMNVLKKVFVTMVPAKNYRGHRRFM